jgi:hypothetical protein
MKSTCVSLPYTPEQAEQLLHLLDEMRDLLWQCYGVEITEAHQPTSEEETDNTSPPFDDPIDF